MIEIEFPIWSIISLNKMLRKFRYISERRKLYRNLILIIKSQRIPHIHSRVSLNIIRHSPRYMDWDNLIGGSKYIIDAIVKAGVLKNDSPDIIKSISAKQIKDKNKKVVVQIIQDYEE